VSYARSARQHVRLKSDSGGVRAHLGGGPNPPECPLDASRLVSALQRRGVAIRDRPRWAAAMSVKFGIDQAGEMRSSRASVSGPRDSRALAVRDAT
jgi:hypothetical protein